MLSKKLAGAIALAFGLLAAGAQDAAAAVYTVDNANSSGAGSLRNLITAANNNAGLDTIEFNLAGAVPQTITPMNLLPLIRDPVIIDGYSEPDSTPPAEGVNPVIQVAIDASNVNRGLRIAQGGSGSTIRGLSIHSSTDDAIEVAGDGNRIEGNYLGLTETGVAASNVSDGVEIDGNDNVVGGTAAADRNVISANGFAGVSVLGNSNRVEGNTIGTDPNVRRDLGNQVGVWLYGEGNVVGSGPAGNVMSGNDIAVQVESGTDNEIMGNLIGTNATGDADFDDNNLTGDHGVLVESTASETLVGTADAGNVIAGASDADVQLAGDDNVVQGNRLGVNADGDAALYSMYGIEVTGDDNTIGGWEAGEGNVVSGHVMDGIVFFDDPVTNEPSVRNIVEGNLIGVNAAGDAALPNGDEGIELVDANHNAIVGNVIAGNDSDGVLIRTDDTTTADENVITANAIGTDATGTLDLGNGGAGVRVDDIDRPDGNQIGGADGDEPGNTIAFNGEDGVALEGGATTAIVRNAIFDNDGLGIDLADDEVTLNDAGDGDAGANGLLNFPEITGASATEIDWQLVDSLPTTFLRLDFYANDACDGLGHGEGQRFLGTTRTVTDLSGDAAGTTPIIAAAGESVTATATVSPIVITPGGGLPPFPPAFALYQTSEFSLCQEVV